MSDRIAATDWSGAVGHNGPRGAAKNTRADTNNNRSAANGCRFAVTADRNGATTNWERTASSRRPSASAAVAARHGSACGDLAGSPWWVTLGGVDGTARPGMGPAG